MYMNVCVCIRVGTVKAKTALRLHHLLSIPGFSSRRFRVVLAATFRDLKHLVDWYVSAWYPPWSSSHLTQTHMFPSRANFS